MSENILDLGNIETQDLIKELRSRGYRTDLLWCLEDVEMNLEQVNQDRDTEEQIVLDEMEKQDILDNLDFDYYTERINSDIYDEIWNNHVKDVD